MNSDYHMSALFVSAAYSSGAVTDYEIIRNEMSREFRWYLLGMMAFCARQANGSEYDFKEYMTLEQISKHSGFSLKALDHYRHYYNLINRIRDKQPVLAEEIMAGNTRLRLETTLMLTGLSLDEISSVMSKIKTEGTSVRKVIAEQKAQPKTVKDTPRYDPDAQFNGLVYTIPSWISALNRINVEEKREVSPKASKKLTHALAHLKNTVEITIKCLMEVQ